MVLDLRLVMLSKIVTRSSAIEKGCQEKLCVLRSAFELKLKKLVDYNTICTCQVGLSVVSSCCLFSLSVSLLFSFISIIILYIVFLTVSVLFPFSLLFSSFLYFISISLLFSYIVYPVLFPFILFLPFIRLSCIRYGNLVVSAGSRCCLKQQLISRVRISCEVQGYNAVKSDYVAWCNLDPVGDRCQKSRKTQKNIMKALEYLL
ncbi:hypothetical protein BD560DRAFT_229285 [Blakeslea trispora]|nr:hypothetical protein BD560DRAFT_229285 [Blakeslea trispora]